MPLPDRGDFYRLWIGATLSLLGSSISALAIPLVALLDLGASTFEVGLLTAVQSAAFLVLGLPAGAWVDRLRRRPVLITADLLRAVLLGSIPVAALLGVLSLGQLYVVLFAVGACTVFFDVANQSYLPTLVGRPGLLAANGRLEISRSAAHMAGPSVAGILVQAFTAPVAVLADAVSFLWSAAWLAAIRTREPRTVVGPETAGPAGSGPPGSGPPGSGPPGSGPPGSDVTVAGPAVAGPTGAGRSRLRADIAAGIRLVAGHRVLRALAGYGATTVLFLSMGNSITVVFLAVVVGLSPAGIGALVAVSGTGAVLGAVAAAPIARHLGSGRTLGLTATVSSAAMLLIPLTATGPRLACYVIGTGVSSFCIVAFNVVSVSLRQSLCPAHLLGRMNATMRFLTWGLIPLGGLLGGALGTVLGLRPTLWVGAAGCAAATLWLLGSGQWDAAQPETAAAASSSASRAASSGA